MKAKKQIIIYQDIELKINEVTLLSDDEYLMSKDVIPLVKGWWWLRSPGDEQNRAASVLTDGSLLDRSVNHDYAVVRPALRIGNLEALNLMIGDKVKLAGLMWTKVCDDLLLCDEIVGETCFRGDLDAKNANDYEASDIKRWLENWAKEKGLIQNNN